mmetsp:Transcript_358/g.1107  ORF Transcript_358/g.1107 Transcript_358/m.1107 type:complete len:253 (+) Transcript_358:785-1543(+)
MACRRCPARPSCSRGWSRIRCSSCTRAASTTTRASLRCASGCPPSPVSRAASTWCCQACWAWPSGHHRSTRSATRCGASSSAVALPKSSTAPCSTSFLTQRSQARTPQRSRRTRTTWKTCPSRRATTRSCCRSWAPAGWTQPNERGCDRSAQESSNGTHDYCDGFSLCPTFFCTSIYFSQHRSIQAPSPTPSSASPNLVTHFLKHWSVILLNMLCIARASNSASSNESDIVLLWVSYSTSCNEKERKKGNLV